MAGTVFSLIVFIYMVANAVNKEVLQLSKVLFCIVVAAILSNLLLYYIGYEITYKRIIALPAVETLLVVLITMSYEEEIINNTPP